jgi:two-component system, OmpR family, alkaline phosphatase synthesis response regulator PhoP
MNSPKTILVVEDDSAIRQGVVDALGFEGHPVLEASTGPSALEVLGNPDLALVLLDLTLPGLDGLEVLPRIREVLPNLPVIIMTARGSENDRVRGLKKGADDYVSKPFSIRELLARVEAVLRRSRPVQTSSIYEWGGLTFEPDQCRLSAQGKTVELTEKETNTLSYLCHHMGRIVGRDELLERVWQLPAKHVETRTIDMTLSRLREKIRSFGEDIPLIETVRGQGYRLGLNS